VNERWGELLAEAATSRERQPERICELCVATLGMGGGGMSGFMTGRSTSNLLTRATAILAAAFMTTSVLLVVMHNRERAPRSILEQGAPAAPAEPQPPSRPAEPAQPNAPLAR